MKENVHTKTPTLQDGLGIALSNINATNAQQQNPNGWHFQLGASQHLVQ